MTDQPTGTPATPVAGVSPSSDPGEQADLDLIARTLVGFMRDAEAPTQGGEAIAQQQARRAAAAVLSVQREAAMAACDCYPQGFTPETYEGPMPWCPTHGDPTAAWDQAYRQGVDDGRQQAHLALGLRPDGTPWTTR